MIRSGTPLTWKESLSQHRWLPLGRERCRALNYDNGGESTFHRPSLRKGEKCVGGTRDPQTQSQHRKERVARGVGTFKSCRYLK